MSDSPDAGADVGADTPEGRLVAEGSFKLDRARAIDKLAHFQLDDPRRYVAELVSSAVCADATGIHIRNDADDFEIEWDGDHPTLDELESLFDTIFYRGEDRRQRMLQHLAQGIFGAAGLDPQWVRLHRPGLTVDLTDPAQPQSTPNDRTEGMRVEVRERMSWAVLREWGRKAFKDPEELLLVKQVAVACPVPIFVGGASLPVGLDRLLGDTPAGAQDIEGLQAGEAGQVWLVERNTAESAGILVVRDGIVVDRIPLIVGPLALCGWVRCDGMTLDASQAGVVRRGRWTEVWKLARASARNAVHQAIVDGVGPPVDAAVLRKAGQALVAGPTCVLADVPLFDDLAGVPWSLRELSARSRVLVCGDRELFDAELAVPQLMGGVVVLRRLKSLGIDNVVDGEAELKARVWGRLRRTSLRKTLQPLTVPARVQLSRDLDGMALRGGLGLQRASPDDRPPTKAALHVELRVDGLPVELRTVPGPGPMLVRVESAALEADGAFVEVLAGAALDRAMAEAQRVGDALLERALKDAPFEPEVRKVLWTWVRHHTRGRRRGRIAALPDALRAAPLFLCTDGQRLSIADFPDVAKRNGRLDNKGRTVVWTIPAGAAPPRPVEGVLHLDDGDRTLLNHLLEGRVLDVLPQLRAQAEAARRRTQGSEEAKLFGPMLARETIDAPGLLGEVGLRRGDLSASCVCKVIRDRVLLGEVELPVDLPGSVAAVEWAQARPTDDWSGLADPEGAALTLAELLEPHLVALAQVAATAWVADGSTGGASRARGTDRPLPPWLAAVLRRGRDGTSSLGNLPFVRDLGGRVHSLAALGAPLPPGARRSRGPRYLTVPPGTVLPTEIPRDEGGQFDEELGGMLVVDPERAVILEIWLGSGALRSGVPVLDQVRLAWSAFYRKSTHAWEAHPSALGAVHVQKEGFELFVGLDSRGHARSGLELELLHESRTLLSINRTAALPWIARVRGPAIVPDTRLGPLADKGVEKEIVACVEAQKVGVLQRVVARTSTDAETRRVQVRVLSALLARRVKGMDGDTAALVEALSARPLFEDADGGLHPLSSVREAWDQSTLSTVGRLPEGVEMPQDVLWLRSSREVLALLRLALSASPPSVDRLVAQLAKGVERRAAMKTQALVAGGVFAAAGTRSLDGGGRAWFALTDSEPARRTWLVDDRPVLSEVLKGQQGHRVRVVHPELRASPAFDRPEPADLVRHLSVACERELAAFVCRAAAVGVGQPRQPGDPVVSSMAVVVNQLLRLHPKGEGLDPAVADLPLLSVSHGRPRTLADLRTCAASGAIRVAPPGTRGRPLEGAPVVFLADDARRGALACWARPTDAAEDLTREEAAWRRREAPPVTPITPVDVVFEIGLKAPRAGVLVLTRDGQDAVDLLHTGRPLGRVLVPGPVPLAGWVDDPALTPDAWFQKAEVDEAHEALMQSLQDVATQAMAQVLAGEQPPELLVQIGLAAFDGRRELSRALSGRARGSRAKLVHKVVFDTACGQTRTLAQLAGMKDGPRWVTPGTAARSLDPHRPFIVAPPRYLSALKRLLGGEDADEQAVLEKSVAERRALAPLPLALPQDAWLAQEGGEDVGMRWAAGLAEDITARGTVHLRVRGRPVGSVQVPMPGLVAVVELDEDPSDPLAQDLRLSKAQLKRLGKVRAALIVEAGPRAVDGHHRRRRLVDTLGPAKKQLRQRKLPGKRSAVYPWTQAPLLAGPDGPVTVADLLNAQRLEHPILTLDRDQEPPVTKALLVYAQEATSMIFEVLGVPVVTAQAWREQAALAVVAQSVRVQGAVLRRLLKARRKALAQRLHGMLAGGPQFRAVHDSALAAATEADLEAADTPGKQWALAWTLADAATRSIDGHKAVVLLCQRLAEQLGEHHPPAPADPTTS